VLNRETRRVGIEELRDFMRRLLVSAGMEEADAATVAEQHLESDLRGVGVQGFNHLVSSHLPDLLSGRANPRGRPTVVREGPASALVDGDRTGPLAALLACDVAVQKAREAGCCAVGVTNGYDLFQAGLYAERIARHDLVAMVFSDDVIPVVHPVGGVEPIIGSNPMANAVPTEGEPFVLDFAPCATLPTYVRYTQRYGGRLPESVASDVHGNATTDPAAVANGAGHQPAQGAIDPAGHEGYGLLLVIDFLAGALVGSDLGLAHLRDERSRKGHLFVAVDPAALGEAAAFKRAVKARIREVKESKRAPGVDEIRVAGERSHAQRRRSLDRGEVEIDRFCWEDGLKVAERLGVAAPALA
jgi:LDH2 family malate/lactate/ureidoglycolate dehydrogenase